LKVYLEHPDHARALCQGERGGVGCWDVDEDVLSRRNCPEKVSEPAGKCLY